MRSRLATTAALVGLFGLVAGPALAAGCCGGGAGGMCGKETGKAAGKAVPGRMAGMTATPKAGKKAGGCCCESMAMGQDGHDMNGHEMPASPKN